MTPEQLERFMAKVDLDEPEGCWPWRASLGTASYGQFFLDRRTRLAHRVSYEHFVGPIPAGLELDHLCHTADDSCDGGLACPHRRCVNPAHLEPVTNVVNVRRGARARSAYCSHGHPFDERNTYRPGGGHRHCRECNREAARRYKSRRKEAA
jgi:hypothetical protein